MAIGAAVVALLAVATSPGAEHGVPERRLPPSARVVEEDWIARTDDDAVFTVDCRFSHRAGDDPIVHPGRPGASHSHEFFGSAATDASSTGASLRGSATTCEDAEDTAAYWVPTLSVDGVPVAPTMLRAYYRARRGVDVRDVTPPPLGLAMISGDPARTGDDHGHPAAASPVPGDHDHPSPAGGPGGPQGSTGEIPAAGWGCGLRPRRLHATPPRGCLDGSPLTLQLRFPDCWDGRNLDSPDHRGHVARSDDGACPADHPVLMTELQVSVSWPVTGEAATRAAIASGAVQGAHGDFLNGWEPDALAGHVELCIHAKANCTVG